jgi:replicative DNA helicase
MDSEKVLEIHDKVLTQDASLKFIPTGYKVIDKQQGGLGRGRLYTIGAPSGGGKSTFANNLAVNAFQAGYSVRYCSFEMKREECHMRTQSLLTKIPHDKFQLGTLSPEERKKSDKALAKLLNDGEAKGKRLDYFCPARDITIAQLFSEIEHLKFDVVVVDYINLMKSLSPKMSLWENIGEAFRLAKKFAERNDCVLIMLVQVDEETGDVKYAKSIKHHSDGVWVWKWGDEEKETQMVEVDQVKLRNFKPTVFSLQAQFEYCSFTESFGMGSEINPEKPQLTPMKL